MNPILDIAVTVVAAVLAITLHEAAHGYAAMALGDDTAKMAGRLSLNPLRHIDRVGTILLPGGLLLFQLLTFGRVFFMFGWAKPVPVNAMRFRHPRQGMALVAAAGPAMNFCLAFLAALGMHLADALSGPSGITLGVALDSFIIINLALGLFNLLPIPPLDGGRIVVGLLPLSLARRWAQLEGVGLLLVLVVVFLLPRLSAGLGGHFNPMAGIEWAVLYGHNLVLRLAGYDG